MKSGRPEAGEYAAYAQSDIEFVRGDDAVSALRDQEETILAFFRRFTDDTARGLTYAPGKWTLKEVFGHMIDDERILTYRALCIARGDSRPLAGFDENEYVAGADFEERPLAALMDEYRSVRQASLLFFDSLSAEAWRRRGVANAHDVTVRGVAFHIAGHELHHLRTLEDRYVRK